MQVHKALFAFLIRSLGHMRKRNYWSKDLSSFQALTVQGQVIFRVMLPQCQFQQQSMWNWSLCIRHSVFIFSLIFPVILLSSSKPIFWVRETWGGNGKKARLIAFSPFSFYPARKTKPLQALEF